jgi:ABC-type glycerol-3-phosphate transport system substrate-binding protein
VPKKRFIFISIFTVLIAGLVLMGQGCLGGPVQPTPAGTIELTYWRPWETEAQMKPLFEAYQKDHPNVTIKYKQIPFEDYEEALLLTIAGGKGPDIFALPNDYLPRYLDKIQPFDPSVISVDTFKKTFVPVAADDAIFKNEKGEELVWAMPLYMDTLGMFVNRALLEQAEVKDAPQNWDDFVKVVNKLTKRDGDKISQAGAALGTAQNVNHAADILYLLMLQNGTEMVSPDRKSAHFALTKQTAGGSPVSPGTEALDFYTSFARTNVTTTVDGETLSTYCWNNHQQNSLQAFSKGKVAIMFGYAYEIAQLQQTSGLDFFTAKFPQPKVQITSGQQTTEQKPINYASYFVDVINKNSDSQKALEAANFLNFLTSQEQQATLFKQTNRLSARVDMVGSQGSVEYKPFSEQATTAVSFYKKDPAKWEASFKTMIDSVALHGTSRETAIETAVREINAILTREY